MPRVVQSVGGRVVTVGSLVAVAIVFGVWFRSTEPFFKSSGSKASGRTQAKDHREPHRPHAPARPAKYPSLQKTAGDGGVSYGAEPDFDPLGAHPSTPKRPRSLSDLLMLIPEGHSVLGIVDVARLRKYPWAASILARRRLPRLRRYLDRLGFDPSEARHVAFGVDLETRPSASRDKADPRFLGGRYDRPFSIIAAGALERRSLLRRFRQPGPLAAAMVMGRRVYRRAGDYGLSFPARKIVVWSYKRPMGPLLQLLFEDASRSALTPARRKLLRRGGLALKPPAPLVALVWTPQPRRRIPWPFNRLGAASLRAAVLVVRSKGSHLAAEIRLILADARATERVATLLRYVRHIVAQKPVLRSTQLKPVLEAIRVRVQKNTIRVAVEIRPWHARALMAVVHKLIQN
jgi:hypothetical protein